MLYNWDEINKKYGYPLKVKEALGSGEVYRVGRGLYSDRPAVNPLAIVALKYPNAIVTMDTAFFIHGMTDVIPDKTFLATKRNATRIAEPGIVQVFMSERIFEAGKAQMDYDGTTITIYDRERMLVEAMRSSAALPFDYYKEIIAGYRRISNELEYQKIEGYISLFKRKERLRDILQREVL